MSYSISISGHKDVTDPDEGKAFEQNIATKAKQFVTQLEGVTSATLFGGNIGSVNLQEGE